MQEYRIEERDRRIQITIRIAEEYRERLDEEAKEDGLSFAGYMKSDEKGGEKQQTYRIQNFPENLKKYRQKRGKKQTEMAVMLGMNYQNYSKMERGCYKPSLGKLLEICDTLWVTPNDLLRPVEGAVDIWKIRG